jgi:hypothetical protein
VSTISERVARGAAWLDEQRPGWVDEIDLHDLALASPCRCILGQIFGDFDDVKMRGPMARGFNAYKSDYDGEMREFGELEREWRRVITERRAEAARAET